MPTKFEKWIRNDYFINMLAKVYHILIGAISSALLARYYGVILKGDYAYIKELVTIVAILCNVGINQSYSYFYRKHNGKIYHKFINLFTFQLVVNIFLFGLVAVFFRSTLYFYVAIMAPFTIVNQNYQSCMAVENIRLKIILSAILSFVNAFLYLLMYLFCPRVIWIPIAVTILNEIISVFVYTINMKFVPRPVVSINFIKEVISYSWIPMITSLLLTLNYSVDVIFLKHMGSRVHLGLYSTASALISYFWLFPDAFKEVLISRVARSESVTPVLRSIKASLICMVALGIGFALLGKIFIKLLYGTEFTESYFVVLILLIGAFSMIFFKMIGTLFLAEGRRLFYFFSLLASVIINIIFNYITIPIWGMYGAAIASVASYTVCGNLFLFYFLKLKKLRVADVLIPNREDVVYILKLIKVSK